VEGDGPLIRFGGKIRHDIVDAQAHCLIPSDVNDGVGAGLRPLSGQKQQSCHHVPVNNLIKFSDIPFLALATWPKH
jgi:hypothetical protein